MTGNREYIVRSSFFPWFRNPLFRIEWLEINPPLKETIEINRKSQTNDLLVQKS